MSSSIIDFRVSPQVEIAELYHYTSIEALTKIVESQEFHATHAFYMSDASEFEYGLFKIQEAVEKFKPNDALEKEVKSALLNWLTFGFGGSQVFVMSFSERRDDLNQWRSYSPEAQGVCIGFDTGELIKQAKDQEWVWSPCYYDPDSQNVLAKGVVTDLIRAGVDHGAKPEGSNSTQHYEKPFYNNLTELVQVACRLKDPAFTDEREWRFISPVIEAFDDCRIAYKTSKSMLIPFAKFHLKELKKLPIISEVTIGPTTHPELSYESMARYLLPRVMDPKIRRSYIPYRPL